MPDLYRLSQWLYYILFVSTDSCAISIVRAWFLIPRNNLFSKSFFKNPDKLPSLPVRILKHRSVTCVEVLAWEYAVAPARVMGWNFHERLPGQAGSLQSGWLPARATCCRINSRIWMQSSRSPLSNNWLFRQESGEFTWEILIALQLEESDRIVSVLKESCLLVKSSLCSTWFRERRIKLKRNAVSSKVSV